MRPPGGAPRGLSADEAQAWARLAASVVPLHPRQRREADHAKRGGTTLSKPANATTAAPKTSALSQLPSKLRAPVHQPAAAPPPLAAEHRGGLDSHWERRLHSGTLSPDFTLDLHEHSLDAAYQRLLGGLDIARETGARVVLVIAGRERPGPSADRAGQRGAIRAKLLDWLAASRHASAIATIRKAHRRHGGDGALYVILKKPR